MWSWWYVGVVHLRDVEGAPPANRHYPEAEYEFMIISLDPNREGRPPEPILEKIEAGDILGGIPGFLTPPDVVFQFHGVTDEQAAQLAELAVRAIVDGASCDSDFRSWWSSVLSKTLEHIKYGGHPDEDNGKTRLRLVS